jgi:iron complex outermembrane receptor protein
LTDSLNVTLGYRQTEDTKDYTYRRRNPDGTLPAPCTAAGPPAHIANPPNCALSGLFNVSSHFESDRSDYRAAIDWQIGDNFMLYAQESTGYKAGGINPRPFFIIQIEQFGEEELTSDELGFKATLADGRLRVNGALFTNEYEDIQLVQNFCETLIPQAGQTPVPRVGVDGVTYNTYFGPPCIQPGNVGDADVDGYELELEGRFNNFSFQFAYADIDFQYKTLTGSVPAATLNSVAPFTPETKWSVGLQYEWQLPRGGSFAARLDTAFQDDMYANPNNAATNLIENYTLSNARLTWAGPQGWEVAAEVQNLTDEYYWLNVFDQYASSGGQLAVGPGWPRTWAVHLKRSFDFQ